MRKEEEEKKRRREEEEEKGVASVKYKLIRLRYAEMEKVRDLKRGKDHKGEGVRERERTITTTAMLDVRKTIALEKSRGVGLVFLMERE